MSKDRKRALVTGGAGLIGSHVTDLLIEEGWRVRVLDNIEPNTHKRGKPAWINSRADFMHGDLRDRETDRKSTRLNSSHVSISYAVFCLKKKKKRKLTYN